MNPESLTDLELVGEILDLITDARTQLTTPEKALIEELAARFNSMCMAYEALQAGADWLDGQLNMLDAEVPE